MSRVASIAQQWLQNCYLLLPVPSRRGFAKRRWTCSPINVLKASAIAAIRDVESELAAIKAEHDPLASHIFVARRDYRNAHDTKNGKRREMNARVSFNTACELGFRGSLDEWERLMGAVAERGN